MTTKLLTSAILGLLITSTHANETTLSKQELLDRVAIKEGQLSILGKKIIDQEELLLLMKERMYDFAKQFEKTQKQKMLAENSNQEIAQDNLDQAYLAEATFFLKSFFDTNNKKEPLIINSPFFKDLPNTKHSSMLRFYLAKCAYDNLKLDKLLIEWESLSDELIKLYNQLDTIKEF